MEAGLDESRLSSLAGVSEQTIRNYLRSTEQSPWIASSQVVQRVSKALKIEANCLKVEIQAADPPATEEELITDMRFMANPTNVRTVAGKWNASSVDLEIPGVITYQRKTDWHAVIEIRQNGNQIEAVGEDKDGDGIFAKGSLYENGNWLRFNYWVDNTRLRQYGAAMVEYKGDGRTIEGIFVGRDGPHESSMGLVVSKITLNRGE